MDDVLIAAQLLQPHRAAGVELLGGDAHLTAQAELAAVGEAGGAVDIDRRTVHGCCGQRRRLCQLLHPLHRRRRVRPRL